MELIKIKSPDDPAFPPLARRAAELQRIASTQDSDLVFQVGSLLAAARAAAAGSIPDARCDALAAGRLGLEVPPFGHLVLLLARKDEQLRGDAHDFALRRAATSTRDGLALAAPALYHFRDAVTSEFLIDAVDAQDDDDVLVWQVWTLVTLGMREEASDLLVQHLSGDKEHILSGLEQIWPLLPFAVEGDAAGAARLLGQLLERLGPSVAHAHVSDWYALFELLDVCMDPALARRMANSVAAAADADLSESYIHLALTASQREFQGASAALALEGYRVTGNLDCANIAVWRLAAVGRSGDAVRLALEAPWPTGKSDDRLRALYERACQVATSEGQLEELVHQMEQRFGMSPELEDLIGRLRRRPSGDWLEWGTTMMVQDHWEHDRTSQALRKARDFAFRERRGALPLALYVDLYVEMGDFDRALKLAIELRAAWPEHPAPLLKLSQVYSWLAREAESAELIRAAVPLLDEHPMFAPELLDRWARFDITDALSRCERALANPAYAAVHESLERLRSRLQSKGGAT